MRFVCYICREEREARSVEEKGGYLLVICDRGHQQFVPKGYLR